MTDHDGLYHQLYMHPATMADLLREFVAEPWLQDFDLTRMEPLKTKFHVPGLPKRTGDVIWRIPTHSGFAQSSSEVYLLVLLEFQSESDRWMILRVIVYMCLLWLQLLHEKQIPAQGPLPPLFPVVLHNGDTPWLTPVCLRDLIGLPTGSPLWKYQPDGRFFLIDECRFPPEDLQQRDSLSALVFRVEQCRSPKELPALAEAIIAWLEEHPDFAELRQTLAAMLMNAMNLLSGERSPPPTSPINLLEVPTMLQSRMKAWEEKWKKEQTVELIKNIQQELLQEGEQKGKAEMLLRQLQRRFGTVPDWVPTKVLTARASDLDLWSERLFDTDAIEPIFQ